AHCDYSPARATFAQDLLAQGATELRADEAEFALRSVASSVVGVRTGRMDRVAFGGDALSVANGDPLPAKVTGTGSPSGAVVAAFLAVDDDPFAAAASAILAFGTAAEMAAEQARGPGSFEPALLDAQAALGGDDIVQRAKVKHEQG